jgi:hypothetical protein
MPGRSVSSACLLRQVSHGSRVPVLAIAAQIPSKEIGSRIFRTLIRTVSSSNVATTAS